MCYHFQHIYFSLKERTNKLQEEFDRKIIKKTNQTKLSPKCSDLINFSEGFEVNQLLPAERPGKIEMIKRSKRVGIRSEEELIDIEKREISNEAIRIWACLRDLQNFVQWDKFALSKSLKNQSNVIPENLQLNNAKNQEHFLEELLSGILSLEEPLKELYKRCSENKIWEVETKKSGDSGLRNYLSIFYSEKREKKWRHFIPGFCLIIFLSMLLTVLPFTISLTPEKKEFMRYLPVFRVCFVISLISWCVVAVLSVLENYNVNYKSLLSIDPTSPISSQTFLGATRLLILSWVCIFTFFLIDIKFQAWIPTNLYLIYPTFLIISHLIIILLPSTVFKYTYQWRFCQVIWNTVQTGFSVKSPITLQQNIVADALTSLTKPMIDILYTASIFASLIPLQFPPQAFRESMYGCARLLTTLLPFWIRFMQCVNRFKCQNEFSLVHLANAGKYTSGLLVIVVSNISWNSTGFSIYTSRLIFVFTYVIASLYNLIWDVYMDWGLFPDPDNFIRPEQLMLYPFWFYHVITVFDILGRLTWVFTLIPFYKGVRYHEDIVSSGILFLVTCTEVLRRSAWLILKLGNEYLNSWTRHLEKSVNQNF